MTEPSNHNDLPRPAEGWLQRNMSAIIVLSSLPVLGYITLRNEPIEDAMFSQVIRVFLSVAAAMVAKDLPGYLDLNLGAGEQQIKAVGAVGVLVLTYLGTPYISPALNPDAKRDPPALFDSYGMLVSSLVEEADGSEIRLSPTGQHLYWLKNYFRKFSAEEQCDEIARSPATSQRGAAAMLNFGVVGRNTQDSDSAGQEESDRGDVTATANSRFAPESPQREKPTLEDSAPPQSSEGRLQNTDRGQQGERMSSESSASETRSPLQPSPSGDVSATDSIDQLVVVETQAFDDPYKSFLAVISVPPPPTKKPSDSPSIYGFLVPGSRNDQAFIPLRGLYDFRNDMHLFHVPESNAGDYLFFIVHLKLTQRLTLDNQVNITVRSLK